MFHFLQFDRETSSTFFFTPKNSICRQILHGAGVCVRLHFLPRSKTSVVLLRVVMEITVNQVCKVDRDVNGHAFREEDEEFWNAVVVLTIKV